MNKMLCLLILLVFIQQISTYSRDGGVQYARDHCHNINHQCGYYTDCTPCSYWGSEHCGYGGNGGDCANFVSQCVVLGGGHPNLSGSDNCRGYPCGFEEIGAKRLGDCLIERGWTSTCDYLLAPPDNIQAGDVLIYHVDSCDSWDAHAVYVTEGAPNALITCHSNEQLDVYGDPAAKTKSEIILTYPGLTAIFTYRIAHVLYNLEVPILPRALTEYAHGKTGIDIHPGAQIDGYFFIDHGTGIVIGETSIIGKHVKLYQGVTLGALSLREGQRLSGTKRHPTVKDNVTIYSGASVFGGETIIGENTTLGSNVFITSSVEPNMTVTILGEKKHKE